MQCAKLIELHKLMKANSFPPRVGLIIVGDRQVLAHVCDVSRLYEAYVFTWNFLYSRNSLFSSMFNKLIQTSRAHKST
jgi:hypothetical protein